MFTYTAYNWDITWQDRNGTHNRRSHDQFLVEADFASVTLIMLPGSPAPGHRDITSVSGLDTFPNLESLSIQNCSLTSIDVHSNLKLKTLEVDSNFLTSVDVSNNTLLENLTCNDNLLVNIFGINAKAHLQHLYCDHNKLTSLDLTGLDKLHRVSCANNQLTYLNITDCKDLAYLACQNNNLSTAQIDWIALLLFTYGVPRIVYIPGVLTPIIDDPLYFTPELKIAGNEPPTPFPGVWYLQQLIVKTWIIDIEVTESIGPTPPQIGGGSGEGGPATGPAMLCDSVVFCETFSDYANLSTEAPDSNPYIVVNFGDPQLSPRLGSDWQTNSCLGICDSLVSQAAANQCAANNQLICLSNPSGPGVGGSGTSFGPGGTVGAFGAVDPRNPPLVTGSGLFNSPIGSGKNGGGTGSGSYGPLFRSAQVTAVSTCPDGSRQSYTLPAGYVLAPSQILADRAAQSQAPILAAQNRECLCTWPDMICAGELYDYICTPIIPGFVAPLSFTGLLMPPGINASTADPAFPNSLSIFGICLKPGNYTKCDVLVTDGQGKSKDMAGSISVMGLTNTPIGVDSQSESGYSMRLPEATCNKPYGTGLTADGGTPPYTYSVDPAMIPAWIHVSAGGQVYGTPGPTDTGIDFYFDVAVTDHRNRTCNQTVVVPVKCGVDTPPDATLCTPYSHVLVSCPTTHQMNAWTGVAPPGMLLDPDGTLHGKPTSLGANGFTVFVFMDDGSICTAAVILNVLPDGTGVPSAIKDIVWVPVTILGSGSSSMNGTSGAVSASGTWDNPTCDWGGASQRAISRFKNCSAGSYVAHIAVNWTLRDNPCAPNPPGAAHHPYGTVDIRFGAYGAVANVLLLNCGNASLGTPESGSGSVDVTIPTGGDWEIMIQVNANGGGTLTANVSITPATPP